jgi:molecular chaperone DnaJ
VPETPCSRCNGQGRELRDRNWDVEIPAGIDSGQRIRIAGAGHAGEAGAGDGDLYIEVSVRDDPRFERHGDQLVSILPISVTRAMLGGKVTVETLDGEREVEVPSGAQQGERLTLRGEGLPSLRSRARGDHHVVLEVVIPKKLNRKQRDLAEQLDETLSDP